MPLSKIHLSRISFKNKNLSPYIYIRQHSTMNWGEFLREISLVILLNRSNDNITRNQARRAAIPSHLANASVVLRSRLPSLETSPPTRLEFSRLNTTGTPMLPDISCDESFRKHARLLEKLNRLNEREALQRKQLGSSLHFTIVENIREENINLPKLKPNARDDRRTITDPWTAVKELQQLRNTPIPLKRLPNIIIKTDS